MTTKISPVILGPQGITGTVAPNATVKAINLATLATTQYGPNDFFLLGETDAQGKFEGLNLSGEQAFQSGDPVRLMVEQAGGKYEVFDVKVQGSEPDSRNSTISLGRISAVAAPNGDVTVSNTEPKEFVAEPGANVVFINRRTGHAQVISLNDEGTFPDGTRLKGQANDVFDVAVSDGVNNLDARVISGQVRVTDGDVLPDPAPHRKDFFPDGTPKFSKVALTGPTFGPGGPTVDDVLQATLPNCFFPAVTASLVCFDPAKILELVTENADRTYTLNFKALDWFSGAAQADPATVDRDIYMWNGKPTNGRTSGSQDPAEMKTWYPMLEKGYIQNEVEKLRKLGDTRSDAELGYNLFEQDSALQIIKALTGRDSAAINADADTDRVWNTICRAVDGKHPAVVATFPADQHDYTGSGIIGSHAYSVLGYETDAAGGRWLLLRNPWGQREPGSDGKDDGRFRYRLEDVQANFMNVMYGL